MQALRRLLSSLALSWVGLAGAQGVQSLPLGDVLAAPGSVALSADGQVAAHVSALGSVLLWDPSTGRALPGTPELKRATAVALSRDGRWLAVGQEDGRLQLWSRHEPLRPMRELRGHSGGIAVLAFSADDGRLASGSRDGTAQVFDIGTGQRQQVLDSVYNGHAAEGVAHPVALAFAAGDQVLLVQDWRQRQYDSDRVTSLWTLPQGVEIGQRQGTSTDPERVRLAAQAVGGAGWLWAYSGTEHLTVQRLDGCGSERALAPMGYADTVAVDPLGRWVAEGRDEALNFVELASGRVTAVRLPARALALLPQADGRSLLALLATWMRDEDAFDAKPGAKGPVLRPARLYRVAVPAALTNEPALAAPDGLATCTPGEAARRSQQFVTPEGLAPLTVTARLSSALPAAAADDGTGRLGLVVQLRFDAAGRLMALYDVPGGGDADGAGVQVWQLATGRVALARRLAMQRQVAPAQWLGMDWAVRGPNDDWELATSGRRLLDARSEYTPSAALAADDATRRLYRVVGSDIEQVTAEGQRLPSVRGRSAIAGIAARNGRLLVRYRDGGMELFSGTPLTSTRFRGPAKKSNAEEVDDWSLDNLMLSASGRYVQYVANPGAYETPGFDAAWRLADGKQVGTGTPAAPLPTRADRVVALDIHAHRLAVWDFDRNEAIARLPRQRSRDGQGVYVPLKAAISEDGRLVASASPDGLVRVWDIDAHRLLGEARVGAEVTALAFDVPGRQVAVGRADGQVWVLALP